MTQTPQPVRDWQKDMEMCEAATPGPWYSGVIGKEPMAVWYNVIGGPELRLIADHINEQGNVRFTAEARTALPYWLQKVRDITFQAATAEAFAEDEKARADRAEDREQQSKELLAAALGCLIGQKGSDDPTVKAFLSSYRTLYPDTPAPAAPKEGSDEAGEIKRRD